MQSSTLLAPSSESPIPSSSDVLALVADSVICTDDHGRILLFNRAAEVSFGYEASEILGQQIEVLMPEQYRTEHFKQVRAFGSGQGQTKRVMGHKREVWGLRKDGEHFPAEASVSRDVIDGRTVLTVVHRDISETKQLAEEREAIARESDHRIRNLLSVVNSMVRLSARAASSMEELRDSLLDRLAALSRTQDVLRDGAQQSTDVTKLLAAEFAPYASNADDSYSFKGPTVRLSAKSAQALGLVLHELATNSAKYGAWSVPTGHVLVTTSIAPGRAKGLFAIRWQETGGPAVQQPQRQGFGTTLIKTLVGRGLQGEIELEHGSDGFCCLLTMPLDVISGD